MLGGFHVVIILVAVNHHPDMLLFFLLRPIYTMRLRLRGRSVDLIIPRVLDTSHRPQLLLLDALHLHSLL